MATRIPTAINDGSSSGLKLTLLDSDEAAADAGSITSITYTVTDTAGNVIDSLLDESVTPTNPVTIPLDPDATVISGTAKAGARLVTVTWTYTDANLGAGTVHNEEFFISINNFTNINPAA